MSWRDWTGEIEESRGRLFATPWPVAEQYVIEGGVVFPMVSGKKYRNALLDPTYMPMARPELPGEFAKVAGGGEEAVLRFVRWYGLPGYADALTDLEASALILARDSKDTVIPIMIDKGYDPQLEGDPLAWILAHADTVKLAGELAAALPRGGAVQALLERRLVQKRDWQEISYARAKRGWTRPSQVGIPFPGRPIGPKGGWEAAALKIIAAILNANLGGVRRAVHVEGKPLRVVSLFWPQNLLDCIYWLLADAVTGEQLRQCPECGHFFVATTDRMKYCPPPRGVAGPSRCMHRAKVRRWRKGQQEVQPRRKGPGSQRRPR